MNRLPVTGTSRLLDLLDPYIPDDFITEHWTVRPLRGPRWHFSAAQLWRSHLLALLTPVHSLNLLAAMLPEQRAWRTFARLRHRHRADRRHRFACCLQWIQKKTRALTPPSMQRWVDALSRPARAVGSSATKSIAFVCGGASILPRCCWCRWSVGWRQPMFPKAACSFPVSIIATSAGRGGRAKSPRTWVIWRPKGNACVENAGMS